MYGKLDRPTNPERRLFPGLVTPALAVVATIPPFTAPVVACVGAGVIAADLALGVNGVGYGWLYSNVEAVRALRVPARSAMILAIALAVLSGFGSARLLRERNWRARVLIVGSVVLLLTIENRPRALELSRLVDRRPMVYAWLASQPPGVVCEYPVGNLQGRVGPQDATYMYYASRHWDPLVNGYSGFAPPSYAELLHRLRAFPNDDAIEYLRQRGVSYLLVHSPFYIRGDFNADVRALEHRSDMALAGTFAWKGGGVTAAFRLRPLR